MTSAYEENGGEPFSFTDKRKVNPEGGAAGQAAPAAGAASGATASASSTASASASAGDGAAEATASAASSSDGPNGAEPMTDAEVLDGLDFEAEPDDLAQAKAEIAELTDAVQRERASFINFRTKSNERIEAAKGQGVESLLRAILPALDDITRARGAGELEGPFAAIADKLGAALEANGVSVIGVVGEEFDPTIHEALMHSTSAEATSTTVNLVIEPGYQIGDRVVRAARVGVVGPE